MRVSLSTLPDELKLRILGELDEGPESFEPFQDKESDKWNYGRNQRTLWPPGLYSTIDLNKLYTDHVVRFLARILPHHQTSVRALVVGCREEASLISFRRTHYGDKPRLWMWRAEHASIKALDPDFGDFDEAAARSYVWERIDCVLAHAVRMCENLRDLRVDLNAVCAQWPDGTTMDIPLRRTLREAALVGPSLRKLSVLCNKTLMADPSAVINLIRASPQVEDLELVGANNYGACTAFFHQSQADLAAAISTLPLLHRLLLSTFDEPFIRLLRPWFPLTHLALPDGLAWTEPPPLLTLCAPALECFSYVPGRAWFGDLPVPSRLLDYPALRSLSFNTSRQLQQQLAPFLHSSPMEISVNQLEYDFTTAFELLRPALLPFLHSLRRFNIVGTIYIDSYDEDSFEEARKGLESWLASHDVKLARLSYEFSDWGGTCSLCGGGRGADGSDSESEANDEQVQGGAGTD
ncbi:hypothetical protein JCM10207_002730 [Rhodosporidiobolus poonsookiae]